jgi:two-component system cell cycle response regulator CpdR
MPRVLIADDEASMRTLVARAIAMDGHDTVTAEDGAEALEILSREAGKFDLLLTDIQMPVMDGIALALSAARDFPDLTILLMTGFADQRERASGLNAIARRHHQAVFGGRYPCGGGGRAGGAEAGSGLAKATL